MIKIINSFALLIKVSILLSALFIAFYSNYAFGDVLRRAEEYLNNIKTLEAEFEELDQIRHTKRTGKIYISRPGKLKFEYLMPKHITVIANENNVLYFDHELQESSYISSQSTLLKVLNKYPINLRVDTKILNYYEEELSDDLIITFTEVNQEVSDASLSMRFSTKPFRLIEVLIDDAANNTESRIIFKNIKHGIPLKNEIFTLKDQSFFQLNN